VSLCGMRATEVRCDIPVKELKVAVRGEKNSKVCRRLLGIIHLLEGGSRQEAQNIACLSVNVMRKWIKRFNQDGIEGLRSIKQTGRPPRMSWEVKQALRAKVLEGPGEEGLARYRLIDMKQYLKEEFGVDTSVTRIWGRKGERQRLKKDFGFESTHIYSAVCPERDLGEALVINQVSKEVMELHLEAVSARIPENRHAIMVMDRAPWHRSLKVPKNITVVHLPPYSPELNPHENVWEFLKNTYLSNKVYRDLDHVCK